MVLSKHISGGSGATIIPALLRRDPGWPCCIGLPHTGCITITITIGSSSSISLVFLRRGGERGCSRP